jgi:hypothetical protein
MATIIGEGKGEINNIALDQGRCVKIRGFRSNIAKINTRMGNLL